MGNRISEGAKLDRDFTVLSDALDRRCQLFKPVVFEFYHFLAFSQKSKVI